MAPYNTSMIGREITNPIENLANAWTNLLAEEFPAVSLFLFLNNNPAIVKYINEIISVYKPLPENFISVKFVSYEKFGINAAMTIFVSGLNSGIASNEKIKGLVDSIIPQITIIIILGRKIIIPDTTILFNNVPVNEHAINMDAITNNEQIKMLIATINISAKLITKWALNIKKKVLINIVGTKMEIAAHKITLKSMLKYVEVLVWGMLW